LKLQKTPIPHEALERFLDTEKLKYCFECGICTASCPMAELLPKDYNPRVLLEKIYHTPNDALKDPALWLCAWCYRCYHRCPQKVKLPEILLSVRKIAKEQGKIEGFNRALDIISQEIPFPTSFGYVCLHPERVQLENMLENLVIPTSGERKKPHKARTEAGVKIAVVGAGPAGLTAAHELVGKGYTVTVFESSPQPGGMLRQCIPEFRLPKKYVEAEIRHIQDMGVEIKTNVKVGRDLAFDDLWQQGFRAIFVSTGAHRTRNLNVEGENLKGVWDALDFLLHVNNDKKVDLGERVVIVGGGNVAIDSARTAIRLGTKEVTILYRRSRDEMPANPSEVAEAEHEGVKVQFLVAPKLILGQNDHVTGIECLKMTLTERDATGRRSPKPVEGSEFTVQADTVILAIGEAPDISFLPKEVEINESNTIAVEPFTATTNMPGVFAGGDCVSGPATVIEAVLAGRRAAVQIDQFLKSATATHKKQLVEGRKQG
jgi:NADH-quinone oxidoreductase subunit F